MQRSKSGNMVRKLGLSVIRPPAPGGKEQEAKDDKRIISSKRQKQLPLTFKGEYHPGRDDEEEEMIGKLLCFLGLHKWERDGKQTDMPGWVKVKCRRQSAVGETLQLSYRRNKARKYIDF